MTLAIDVERSFHISSQLRSSEYHQLYIYILDRLSLHCDDPPGSKIRNILKKILDIRKCPRSGAPRPLCIPMLANSTFQKSIQIFVSHLMQTTADSLIPFNFLSEKIVIGKHNQLLDFFIIISYFYNNGKFILLHSALAVDFSKNIPIQ